MLTSTWQSISCILPSSTSFLIISISTFYLPIPTCVLYETGVWQALRLRIYCYRDRTMQKIFLMLIMNPMFPIFLSQLARRSKLWLTMKLFFSAYETTLAEGIHFERKMFYATFATVSFPIFHSIKSINVTLIFSVVPKSVSTPICYVSTPICYVLPNTHILVAKSYSFPIYGTSVCIDVWQTCNHKNSVVLIGNLSGFRMTAKREWMHSWKRELLNLKTIRTTRWLLKIMFHIILLDIEEIL